MNEKNHDYLTRQIKFTGFGDGHNDGLKEKMAQGQTDFVLFHQAEFGKDNVVATLQFKKSEETDMYFFNRYSMVVKTADESDMKKQTFYLGNHQDNITFKEAYNLMSGRAIHKEITPKEGEKFNAWLQLDFKDSDANGNFKMKQFHPNYGYDLSKAISEHNFKEMKDPGQAEKIMQSLERGNRQAVTLEIKGNEQKVFIEAVPQFKAINFYDASMKRINKQNLYEGKDVTQSKEQSKTQKADDEEGGAVKQKQNKKKGQKIS